MRPQGRFVCCIIALTMCIAAVPNAIAQGPNLAAQSPSAIAQSNEIGYPAPTIHNSGQRATAVPLPALPSANAPASAHPSNAAWVAGPASPNHVAQASYSAPATTAPSTQTNNQAKASVDSTPTKRTPLNAKKLDSSLEDGKRSGSNTLQMLFSVGSSLLIVIGLFLGVAWCYRKTLNNSMGGIPKQVVSVLGRTAIAPRQQLVLVRFGSKMVLISLNQGETRTISEITDPIEVDQLAGACESHQPHSLTNSFRTILNQSGGAV